jgi:hypothetical protein
MNKEISEVTDTKASVICCHYPKSKGQVECLGKEVAKVPIFFLIPPYRKICITNDGIVIAQGATLMEIAPVSSLG